MASVWRIPTYCYGMITMKGFDLDYLGDRAWPVMHRRRAMSHAGVRPIELESGVRRTPGRTRRCWICPLLIARIASPLYALPDDGIGGTCENPLSLSIARNNSSYERAPGDSRRISSEACVLSMP